MTCKGVCSRYQARKLPNCPRYAVGQKRCQVCEIFINWPGLYCPCCGYKLRQKPRNLRYKSKLRETDSKIPKVEYVGSGEDPKLTPYIDPDYLTAVPRLQKKQYELLKESIEQEGLHEPIILAKDGKILDGHTRFEICALLGKTIKYVVKDFSDKIAEKMYVVTSNLRRRQLSNYEMVVLLDDYKKILHQENNLSRRKILSEVKAGKRPKLTREQQMINSADYKIGKIIGVGPTTVQRINYIRKHGTEQENEDLKAGTKSVNFLFYDIVKRRYKNGEFNTHSNPHVSTRNCEKCGAICRKRKLCHVHKDVCCTQCEWGE